MQKMLQISPELALVDPELAEIARACLPTPPDCLEPRLRVGPESPRRPRAIVVGAPITRPASVALAPAPVPAAAVEGPRRAVERGVAEERPSARRRPAPALIGAWLLISAVVASPLLAFLPAPESSRPRLLERTDAPEARRAGSPSSTEDLGARWGGKDGRVAPRLGESDGE